MRSTSQLLILTTSNLPSFTRLITLKTTTMKNLTKQNSNHKYLTLFLGISMFVFGVLKFINPFKGWYQAQVYKSNLPIYTFSYWSGQIGEIMVGIILIILAFLTTSYINAIHKILFHLTHIGIVVMMLVACYVHLHPNVPSDVLPLKIKPPFIPIVFILLAAVNVLKTEKLNYK